jgi:hypothetical protein
MGVFSPEDKTLIGRPFPSSGIFYLCRADAYVGRKNSLRKNRFYIFVSGSETNPNPKKNEKNPKPKNQTSTIRETILSPSPGKIEFIRIRETKLNPTPERP